MQVERSLIAKIAGTSPRLDEMGALYCSDCKHSNAAGAERMHDLLNRVLIAIGSYEEMLREEEKHDPTHTLKFEPFR